jgi:hypothetical protein
MLREKTTIRTKLGNYITAQGLGGIDIESLLKIIQQCRTFLKKCPGGICSDATIINNNFLSMLTIKNFIISLSNFFVQEKSSTEYKKLYNALIQSFGFQFTNGYVPEGQNRIPSLDREISLLTTHPPTSWVQAYDDLTWLSIQIYRYNQTLKVYPQGPLHAEPEETYARYLERKKKMSYKQYIFMKHLLVMIINHHI